ncbi:hypothetical protein [Parasedimentitalea huanghaiensis]|uniref:Secreted protein n=1 Tax=Parasedimentitalea huanghaiensis TaxID=2682100 RepID=A0A6L6WGY6_9RHOB|nr:hypothetical protein [Zongyanglinia huanghaiensis]MVO17103.1 hypothetical protein [Zongyanglinia huanghaiensis]
MNKYFKNLIIGALFGSAALAFADVAKADAISGDCDYHDTIGDIPSPVSENVFDIVETDGFLGRVRISLSFAGEPVSAGAWVVLHIENDEGSSDCYLVHKGSTTDPRGFNDAYVSKTIVRPNHETEGLEIFIPVSEYPYASDENHIVRMVEINISKSGQPFLVE